MDRYQARIQRAVKAGVRIAIGSDLYYQYPGRTRGQVAVGMYRTYVASGMPAMDVLLAATTVGTIEAGRMADIIAVRGDLLKDIANPSHQRQRQIRALTCNAAWSTIAIQGALA